MHFNAFQQPRDRPQSTLVAYQKASVVKFELGLR